MAEAGEGGERDRIREAVLDLVFDHGCDGTSVEMVVARAGVEEGAFEREFGDLENCFLEIYLESNDRFRETVEAAYAEGETWRENLRSAAYAAARFLEKRPREVRLNVSQVFAAGEMAVIERDRYYQLFVDYIDAGRQELDDPDSMSRSVAEGVMGSIAAAMFKGVAQTGDAGKAEDFVPELMFIAVRPYLGHEVALEELQISPPP
jgi:AcrR family transcriptional regulator